MRSVLPPGTTRRQLRAIRRPGHIKRGFLPMRRNARNQRRVRTCSACSAKQGRHKKTHIGQKCQAAAHFPFCEVIVWHVDDDDDVIVAFKSLLWAARHYLPEGTFSQYSRIRSFLYMRLSPFLANSLRFSSRKIYVRGPTFVSWLSSSRDSYRIVFNRL